MYNGHRVRISPRADLPRSFRPNDGGLAHLVQEALDDLPVWKKGQSPLHTAHVSHRLLPMAVKVQDKRKVVWGIHRGHKANRPQISPFVLPNQSVLQRTDLLTIELIGTPNAPELVRAYPGGYTPPLPWMASAQEAYGGRDVCFSFWNEHAYLDKQPSLIIESSRTVHAPGWYRRN